MSAGEFKVGDEKDRPPREGIIYSVDFGSVFTCKKGRVGKGRHVMHPRGGGKGTDPAWCR